ncbi:hypothetical protein [Brevifollis gellanilyticus]|uniref:Uncharacterized protein n=1 Tax=Brevifollis gellanilyticus TaxID=748831 RepID=A0A512MDT0_9BACT|nr:hypothetical protein [Brevifollis gellanilyticus]GEP44852.1 hypothetical protein BGE01nite_41430 [Brevifollis gellanilyticus]
MKPIFSKLLLLAGAAFLGTSAARADIVEITTNITEDTRWSADNVYVLTKIIFVLPPAKLTIEPGTLIRGAADSLTGGTNNPGTLTCSRGAKIIGNATPDLPIVMTSIDDTLVPGGPKTRPVAVLSNTVTPLNFDPNGPTANNAFFHTKLTGGLVICGRTPIGYDGDGAGDLRYSNGVFSGDTLSEPTGSGSGTGVNAAQGNGTGIAVPEGYSITSVTLATAYDPDGPTGTGNGVGTLPASTSFIPGAYGGVSENDDSGIYRFWSVRYGGFNVSANNEINGVTLCGVGRGTTFEWMEVAQNVDDNFEWFGGFVDCKYLFGMFCGDDAIDGDQGYSGNLQHIFAINDNENYDTVGRPGYLTTTAIGRLTSGVTATVSDKLVEWDGSEPNMAGVTPNTLSNAYNFTLLGNKGAVGAGVVASDDAFNCKVGDAAQFLRGVIEDVHDTLWSPGDAGAASNPTISDLRDSLYFNVTTAGATVNGAENLATLAAASNVRAKGHTTFGGLDPRATVNTAATNDARDLTFATIPSSVTSPDFFTPTQWTGAMRDNNYLFGWTWTHEVGLMPTTNIARPKLTLAINGNNPTVSFAATAAGGVAGDAVVYVVERSVDGGAHWVPVGFVQDGVATADAPVKRLADSDAGNLAITVTDSGYNYTGSPVHYRVIPQ